MQEGADNFLCSGRTVGPKIIDICLRVGWTISGTKESYVKFEAFGGQYCIRKMTGNSEMADDFVILPTLFEIEIEKQEEYLWDFVRDIFPDLHPQVKGLTFLASVCYNFYYFIENSHPGFILIFCLFC